MKGIHILLFVFAYVECRKTYPPIDKNANLAFINMEGGSGVRPGNQPVAPAAPASPVKPLPPTKPVIAPATSKPAVPQLPTILPAVPAKPTNPPVVKPVQTPNQIKPVPVNPVPITNPITTPGPGSVKQLVNFYDSQGKASAIRPYTYSQAVKQG